MKQLLCILIFAALGATAEAQTLKSLMVATNGQVVANTGASVLTFTNSVYIGGSVRILDGTNEAFEFPNDSEAEFSYAISFLNTNAAAATRDNLGVGTTNVVNFGRVQVGGVAVSTNGFSGGNFEVTATKALTFVSGGNPGATRTNLGIPLAALTNTNVTNFRSAIGLGAGDTVTFSNVYATHTTEVRTLFVNDSTNQIRVQFEEPANAKTFVRNLTGSTNTNEPFSGLLQYQDPEQNTSMQAVISNGIILRLEEF